MGSETLGWAGRQKIIDAKGKPDIAAKLVLMALADSCHDRTFECFPKMETIIQYAMCSKVYARRKLKLLEALGWIKRINRFAPNGRQTSNSYEIVFDKGVSFDEHRATLNKKGVTTVTPTPIRGKLEDRGEGKPELPLDAKPQLRPLTSTNEQEGADAPSASGAVDKCSPEANWPNRLAQYRKRGVWPPKWGAPMGHAGCIVPSELVSLWNSTQGKAFDDEQRDRSNRAGQGFKRPRSPRNATAGAQSSYARHTL